MLFTHEAHVIPEIYIEQTFEIENVILRYRSYLVIIMVNCSLPQFMGINELFLGIRYIKYDLSLDVVSALKYIGLESHVFDCFGDLFNGDHLRVESDLGSFSQQRNENVINAIDLVIKFYNINAILLQRLIKEIIKE